MRNIVHVFRREFFTYITSLSAYIVLVVFSSVSAYLFFRTFFIIGYADLRGFFSLIPWLYLLILPAITMGSWAEEKRSGTQELLFTLPLEDYEAMLGKFFSYMAVVIVALLLTLPVPYFVHQLGMRDTGPVAGGYIGAVLLASSVVAMGMFASSLTSSQIFAYILTLVIYVFFILLGEVLVQFSLPSFLLPVARYLAILPHYTSMTRGVIDTRDVVYYGTVTLLFLFLNLAVLESRRWGSLLIPAGTTAKDSRDKGVRSNA